MKPNKKHSVEDALSEDKVIDVLKNVQITPNTYSKVNCILKLILVFYILYYIFR